MVAGEAHDVVGSNNRLCFVGDWTLFHLCSPQFDGTNVDVSRVALFVV